MKTINLKIENFLGINESPDGDSGLKMGEAADMVNFRITEEGNLKKMHGYSLFASEGAAAIDGLIFWDDLLVFATDGSVFSFDGATKTALSFDTDVTLTAGKVSMFVFDEKLYFLNGYEYLYWEGGTEVIKAVTGYVPTVSIASNPATGGGTTYEAVNQLTSQRIQKFNGDASATVYHLSETYIDSVDEVVVNNKVMLTSSYTVDLEDGTITFTSAPASGLDNVSIKYCKSRVINTDSFVGNGSSKKYYLSGKEIDSIDEVTVDGTATTAYTADLVNGTITFTTAPASSKAVVVRWTKALTPKMKDMKYVEFFGGENNTRVFAYGDGSNTIYYSELTDGSTKPSAEYFPELNRMDIDLDSVPVTSLVPYYDRLFIHKEDSVFYSKYSTLAGDDGTVIVSFPTTNVTKSAGCTVYGGALNVPNGIMFPSADGVYLTSGGTVYEQMSENLISRKVNRSWRQFDLSNMLALNNRSAGECWFADGNDILVYNYRIKAWYKLDVLESVNAIIEHEGSIYFGNDSGQIFMFNENTLSFNGSNIVASWESGSMDFGYFNQRKWADRIWLTLKSEANSGITLDLESDVTSDYPERTVSHGRATFDPVNFSNYSFNINDKPAAKLVRIKAKKFVFLKVFLKNDSATDTATIMNIFAPIVVGAIKK